MRKIFLFWKKNLILWKIYKKNNTIYVKNTYKTKEGNEETEKSNLAC